VDFAADATTVRRRVHGLTPWPGVTAWWATDETAQRQPLLLRRCEDLPECSPDADGGTLVNDAGLVACGSGSVRLLEVQPPGKRVMDWRAFRQGHARDMPVRFFRDSG
jgi:methionyl-tRNA formyltransferase